MKKFTGSKIFSLLTIVPFLLMFLQLNIEKEIQLYGFHYEGGVYAGPKNLVCILPSGDTITPPHAEFMTISGYDSVVTVSPVMDSWMLYGEFPVGSGVRGYDKFKNGVQTTGRAEKKVYVVIRNIDEYRKEQFIYAGLAAVSSKKSYFEIMKEVSSEADNILSRKDYSVWPITLQNLYSERKEKPKLRVFLSYLSYRVARGEDKSLGYETASISELNNLHLYTHNYLLDNKRLDIKEDRICTLTVGGELFADAVIQAICSLPVSSEKRLAVISKLSSDNASSYQGQLKDSEKLEDNLMPEDLFIENYKQRCELLSGTMYGWSMWLGAMVSSQGTQADRDIMYQIGYNIGSALQVVNDIGDFSSLKKDSLSDWKSLKATAPVYYMAQACGGVEELSAKTSVEIRSYIMSSGAYEKSMKLAKQYRNIARSLIRSLPASEERNQILQTLSAIQTNRYLRSIKNA
ncbi:MAG: polyprenyl synthetase family protein [Candidatus Falkowbacteria bacterium]|nr:polyprenyl synthetase family protein [Candidatus Falkowbacteria bacterium]